MIDGGTPLKLREEELVNKNLKINDDMMDNLIVMFAKTKDISLELRLRPKRFTMTKENKEKLKEMNDVLTKFLQTSEEMTITGLKALHYSAAVILAGTVKSSTKKG